MSVAGANRPDGQAAESRQRPRLLLHAFPSFQLGGAQSRLVQLAQAFGPAYHHVVLAMDACFDAGQRMGPSVRWTPLTLAVRKGHALANRDRFRAELRRLRPDMLLTYNWGAIEWAAANLPRLCHQVHVEDGFGPDEARQQLRRRVLTRRLLLGLSGVPVVVISEQLQRIALDIWKLPRQRVHLLPNGVQLAGLPALRPRAPGEPVRIGTVAGLRPEKNLARLIRAFAQVQAQQPARLVLVGEGPERAALQALADALGVADAVQFTGYRADPATEMAGFDVFALSSDTEQLPLAMLEAMALGLPVVATDVGDIAAILGGVSPGNVSPADDAAFAATLMRAVAQPGRWRLWGQAGQARVQTGFSEAQMLGQWRAVFDGALDAAGPTRPGAPARAGV
jgi:glycosyltransferase involved in cell wall biosynthesis